MGLNANGSPTTGNKYSFLWTGTSSTIGGNNYYDHTDLVSLNNLWSTCRMAAMKIRFIPNAPNDSYSTRILAPVVCAYDPDGLEYGYNTYNVDNLINTSGTRIFSLNRFWKFYRKFPKRKPGSNFGYITYNNTTQPQGNQNIAGQFHDINSGTWEGEQANGHHVLLRYTTALSPSVNYGTLYVTCYWVLRDRFK